MTKTSRALQAFFEQFSLPVYMHDNIPDDVRMPYITFELIEPEPLATALIHANIWYSDTSTTAISAKADEIKAAIGTGVTLPTDGGFVALFRDKSTPFIQLMSDPNPQTKRAYLTMVIHANTD